MNSSYSSRRGRGWPRLSSPISTALVVALAVTGIGVSLWAVGLIDLSRFRSPRRSLAGLEAVPTPAVRIPAHTRVTRDHFWDAKNQRFTFIYLPPRSVTNEMYTNLGDVIGRVLDHEKQPGYVFTESDFLPKGTREGIVAGIPAGKRAVRVPAEKVDGMYGLHPGDRFDLVATLPIDGRSASNQNFNFGGVYGQQLSLQAKLTNWQKQATVHVMVQNGVVVEPMTTRQVPVFQTTLTQGGVTRMKPVQEIVIAVAPDEVAKLTEALAVDAKIECIPRSGRPDDPVDSVTPDLRPVSPFTGPGTAAFTAASGQPTTPANVAASPFTMVETIGGGKRELTAVPRQ
jgi:Flp pilus assembly protein CpaB